MLVSCPQCDKTYRVTRQLLISANGFLRCGTCRCEFVADLDSLDEIPQAVSPAASPETSREASGSASNQAAATAQPPQSSGVFAPPPPAAQPTSPTRSVSPEPARSPEPGLAKAAPHSDGEASKIDKGTNKHITETAPSEVPPSSRSPEKRSARAEGAEPGGLTAPDQALAAAPEEQPFAGSSSREAESALDAEALLTAHKQQWQSSQERAPTDTNGKSATESASRSTPGAEEPPKKGVLTPEADQTHLKPEARIDQPEEAHSEPLPSKAHRERVPDEKPVQVDIWEPSGRQGDDLASERTQQSTGQADIWEKPDASSRSQNEHASLSSSEKSPKPVFPENPSDNGYFSSEKSDVKTHTPFPSLDTPGLNRGVDNPLSWEDSSPPEADFQALSRLDDEAKKHADTHAAGERSDDSLLFDFSAQTAEKEEVQKNTQQDSADDTPGKPDHLPGIEPHPAEEKTATSKLFGELDNQESAFETTYDKESSSYSAITQAQDDLEIQQHQMEEGRSRAAHSNRTPADPDHREASPAKSAPDATPKPAEESIVESKADVDTADAGDLTESDIDTIPTLDSEVEPARTTGGLARWGWMGLLLACLFGIYQQWSSSIPALVQYPLLRPAVEFICNLGVCEVAPRRDLSQLEIAQRHLNRLPLKNVVHPDRRASMEKNALALKVNLFVRNKASFAQPFPDITLTLNDRTGKAVGRRTYDAATYQKTQTGKPPKLIQPGKVGGITLILPQPPSEAVGFELAIAGQ